MQQYPAYLCGLRLEVLLARLVSLVSTSHFCACVCVWKLVMSSTREYSTVKRILGIKRGPVMLYVCVCVSGVKKDFVDNKGDDERQKVETDLIYCFFLPSRKKGLATKTPPGLFGFAGSADHPRSQACLSPFPLTSVHPSETYVQWPR